MDKRQALRGVFWVLDNGANRKELPREFSAKSAVRRSFTLWMRASGDKAMMHDRYATHCDDAQ